MASKEQHDNWKTLLEIFITGHQKMGPAELIYHRNTLTNIRPNLEPDYHEYCDRILRIVTDEMAERGMGVEGVKDWSVAYDREAKH